MSNPTDLARAAELLNNARVIVPHTDADGLASGAIAARATGIDPKQIKLLGRGAMPFGPDGGLDANTPVAILDWGVRELVPPGLIVDHHAPESVPRPKDQLLISGYAEGKPVSTAVLMKRVCPDQPNWLAAVGAVGDYGDAAWKLPECANVVKSHVKKLVPLINAPRRLADGPVRTALMILIEAESPKAALADERIAELDDARAAYKSGFEAAVKTAPKIYGDVAVLRFRSPFQVHPLVATTWSRRLSPRVVIAANDDYLPNRVNFAARCDREDPIDLRKLLRDLMPEVTGEYAHGHDRATGGSLTKAEFETFIERLAKRAEA